MYIFDFVILKIKNNEKSQAGLVWGLDIGQDDGTKLNTVFLID